MNGTKKFFLLTYYQPPRDLQLKNAAKPEDEDTYIWQVRSRPMESQLHKVRDGLASGLLISVLQELGYGYGGPILNLPASVAGELRSAGKIKDCVDPAGGADLLLLATRPPLMDFDFEKGKAYTERYILRSHSDLEKNVFNELQVFFSECSRDHVNLKAEVRLPPDCDDLRGITFKQFGGALVAQASDHCASDETVAYMLSTQPVRPNGPRLLAAFGIGGMETLLLAYLIRTCPEFGQAFRDMINGAERSIALAIFKVPRDIPYPYFSYDLKEFRARLVLASAPAGLA